ncbi:MAG: ribonuclease H-like domain-containing protein [Chloroflexota bacterium]
MIDGGATLARRLERYRAALPAVLPPAAIDAREEAGPGGDLAARLAAAVGGEVVVTAEGRIVRCEVPARPLPVDRELLAALPGQPPPDVPLVCLDTETTGLATAAGTAAFLVGLGWWETSDSYRQVQLLLPDHGEERALLTAIEAAIPPDAWLVTYNGRGFDWPLLTTRFRLARRAAPVHAGHLDLLPVVRRLFRHRMVDARLRTAEAELLGLHRVGDVEGWEIPGRYHEFLRGGPAAPLAEVARHNDQDVRSLAWLLAHLAERYGDACSRTAAPPGDLAGLARSFAREHRLREALDCLDAAADRPIVQTVIPSPSSAVAAQRPDDVPWWSPLRPADFGGRQRPGSLASATPQGAALAAPWTTERIAVDRAHLLRRLGRHADAAGAWSALAAGPGRIAIVAAIELAKLREHRLRDREGALDAVTGGLGAVERRRRLGRPEPALEADLRRRAIRLRLKIGPRTRVGPPVV